MSDEPLVLGIETSCDDTSVCVLEDGVKLRSHLIAAQDIHKLYGGVVPELASRAHLELLPAMVPQALLDDAVARGCSQVLLEVAEGNDPARRLYERFGFAPISRRRGYYGPGKDAVVMRRRLP